MHFLVAVPKAGKEAVPKAGKEGERTLVVAVDIDEAQQPDLGYRRRVG